MDPRQGKESWKEIQRAAEDSEREMNPSLWAWATLQMGTTDLATESTASLFSNTRDRHFQTTSSHHLKIITITNNVPIIPRLHKCRQLSAAIEKVSGEAAGSEKKKRLHLTGIRIILQPATP